MREIEQTGRRYGRGCGEKRRRVCVEHIVGERGREKNKRRGSYKQISRRKVCTERSMEREGDWRTEQIERARKEQRLVRGRVENRAERKDEIRIGREE